MNYILLRRRERQRITIQIKGNPFITSREKLREQLTKEKIIYNRRYGKEEHNG
jgi:hypothetical protein